MGDRIISFLIFIPPILLALTIHEFFHGYVAYKLGDPTPKLAGRLTLNPLPHIDPVGFLMLLIAHIGWAKPVPINPYNLRNPRTGVVYVALAGPASNLVSGAIVGFLIRFFINGTYPLAITIFLQMLMAFVFISGILAFFNLIPLPPLDGWHILERFIKNPHVKYFLVSRGTIILLGIIFLSFIGLDLLGLYLRPLMRIYLKLVLGSGMAFFL